MQRFTDTKELDIKGTRIMKDVVKSYNDKGEYKIINGRRVKVNRKKRRNNLKSYYAFAVIGAVVILLILCMTVFFKYGPDDVKIHGVTLYTKDQIIGIGGISNDGNLVRTDTDKIAERLKKYLVYIEEADVEKSYPSELLIKVTEAQKAADVDFNGKYYVVSKKGRLLECANEDRTSGIPIVKGLELKTLTPGNNLETKDALKNRIFKDLTNQIDQLGFKKITEIDLTDRTNIVLTYDNRIKIYIGSSVDMDYKLKYVKAVIDEKLSDKFRGMLRYNGVNSGISAIPEGDEPKKLTDNQTEEQTEETAESQAETDEQTEQAQVDEQTEATDQTADYTEEQTQTTDEYTEDYQGDDGFNQNGEYEGWQ